MLVAVTVGRVVSAVYAPGTVTSRTQTVVAAGVAGRVVAAHVAFGDAVTPGQAVAQLDSTQAQYHLSQAQQELATTQAQREQAETNVRGAARARLNAARRTVTVQQEQVRAVRARVGAADAQVRVAEAAVANARDAYTRQRFLYERGAIAQRQLVEAESALRTAEAQRDQDRANAAAARQDVAQAQAAVEAARAQVAEAQSGVAGAEAAVASAASAVNTARVRVAAARDALGKYTVRSLVSGLASDTPVAVGDFVQVGEPVLRVVSPSQLYVRADIDETDIGPVTVGQTAYFTSDANLATTYRGTVTRVGASAAAATNTYPVDITRLSTTTGLRVNMSIDVNIVTRTNPHARLLPAAAVVEEPAPHVWQVDARGRLVSVPITVGARDQSTGRVEILSGIEEEEAVVENPGADFRPGQAVRVR
jgi:RND family efflux transporter MFP subunit